MRIGVLPLGRPTFDVPFAEERLAAMLAALDATGHEIAGARGLLLDEAATRAALAELQSDEPDLALILQVTFTDAAMASVIGADLAAPLAIWAIPEPRDGGRLRLNSLCGLNLASHALGLNGRDFAWGYFAPEQSGRDLPALLEGRPGRGPEPGGVPAPTPRGESVAQALRGRRIARIGAHPAGFDTCACDPDALQDLAGVELDLLELDDLFARARAAPEDQAARMRAEAGEWAAGLDQVDQAELDRSLRLKAGLDALRAEGGYDAFAVRCWPEAFTEYGGAVCGPAAMMGEARVPCACEADVRGALTQLLLMEAAQAPVFLTDLVDMDADDDTGVVWHCGQAPQSMRDPECPAEATVHTNRRQPLLFQFALRPGPVTLMRISQARNRPQMALARGEMLRRPMAFTGTSGVIRFERAAAAVLRDIIDSGLEHHMALAYGDHAETLRGAAGALGLPVLEL